MQTSTIPVFENNGLPELEKAWKEHSHNDIDTLIAIAEENFEKKIFAVSLFLSDKILKEKNPSENATTRLRFIRAESLFEFKFFRQAYSDYTYYIKQQGETEEIRKKLRWCKRMVHTGNNGSLLFIAVFGLSIVLMFWALFAVQSKFPEDLNMGLNGDYILYSGITTTAMLVFGLFYRYVIIARMK